MEFRLVKVVIMKEENFLMGLRVLLFGALFCFGCGSGGDGPDSQGGAGEGGAKALLEIDSPENKLFDLDPEASEQTFSVRSDVSWKVSSSVDWITLVTDAGSGNGEVVFQVAVDSGEARSGSITVASVGEVKVSDVLTVNQSPVRVQIASPDSKTLTLTDDAEQTFSVSSNSSWKVEAQADWIIVSTDGSSGNGEVQVKVKANPTGGERTASIVVSAAGNPDIQDVLTVTQPRGATVGDFFLNDGSVVDGTSALSPEQQSRVIGVVFSVDSNRVGAKAKAKLGGSVHGLVMALKDAAVKVRWKMENTDAGLPKSQTLGTASEDTDGYGHMLAVQADTNWQAYYPAFADAEEYNRTVPAPEGTTGWYLPSMGEWFDILQNLGGLDLHDCRKGGVYSNRNLYHYLDKSSSTAQTINDKLKRAGEGRYDEFKVVLSGDTQGQSWFWTSSERDIKEARRVEFTNSGSLGLLHKSKSTTFTHTKVRCVLAF